MNEITITLETPMKEYLDAQLASGKYSNAADFFEHLLREDQKRRGKELLAQMVAQAEASGAAEEVTASHWDAVGKTFNEKYNRGQAP